jgi:hypothetical protein
MRIEITPSTDHDLAVTTANKICTAGHCWTTPVMENVVDHDELAASNDAGCNEFVR